MREIKMVLLAMALIPAGTYTPFLKERPAPGKPFVVSAPVAVNAFHMDITPVTNEEFLTFVKHNRFWSRSRISRIFADAQYLKHWKGDFLLGKASLKLAPVVNVSWFAAKAYCKWKGKTLPREDEWEYAANDRGRLSEKVNQRILTWYSHPSMSALPAVGTTFKNSYGIFDLFGVIWEWTLDFNRDLVGDGSSQEGNSSFFCGGGGSASARPSDYATFMRYAFRSSLKAYYTLQNLGFRCVRKEG